MARALTVSLALLILAAIPRLADAQSGDAIKRARAHYQQGLQFYEAGNYHSAITEFSAADKIAPSPLLDYNMGLCYERLGDDANALARYRSYRNRAPNAPNRAAVDAKIAKLERATAGGAPAPPPVTDPPPNPDPPPVTDPPPSNDPPVTDPPPTTNPPPATTFEKTGDPDLDRVAAVDVNAIAARHPRVAGAAAPQPGQPVGGSGAVGGANNGNRATPAPPPSGGDKPKSKPIYKKWWFWVIVGVSTLIIIDIATSDSGSNDNFRVLDPSMGSGMTATPAQQGGFTLRF